MFHILFLITTYYTNQNLHSIYQLQERQARFFSNILDGVKVQEEGQDRPVFYPRQEPTYFRVAYYGQLFPPFVRVSSFLSMWDSVYFWYVVRFLLLISIT